MRTTSLPASAGMDAEGRAAARALAWRLAPVAVILLAFGLRAFRLGSQELRGDEAFGYFFSLRPYPDIIRATLALHEPHPVGGYFAERAWLALAGHSEFALRFASLWFGVLAVPLLYRLARGLAFPAPAAGLAAGLLALSPYAVWHSQDARMYSMSLALTLASTLLAWEALRGGRRRLWTGYVVVSWLALQTHYFAAFVIVAQNIFVLITRLLPAPSRRVTTGRVLTWCLAQLTLGLLYLPWLAAAGGTLRTYGGNGDSPAFGPMWVRALGVFAAGESLPSGQRLFFACLAGLLLLLGAARLAAAGPAGRRALGLLGAYFLVPLLSTWAGALERPIFNERYLVAATPPFCLLLAAAAAYPRLRSPDRRSPVQSAPADHRLPARMDRVRSGSTGPRSGRLAAGLADSVALVALAGLVMLGAVPSLYRYYSLPAYSKTRGWRELAAAFDRLATGLPIERVRLAQNYPDPTLWYYYGGPLQHTVLPPVAQDAQRARQQVEELTAAGVERVILPLQPDPAWDDGDIAASALSGRYTLIAETQAAAWPVRVYERAPQALAPVNIGFADGPTLAAAAVDTRLVAPGSVLGIHLVWRRLAGSAAGSEKVSLQLLDVEGRLAVQVDRPLGGADAEFTTSYGLLLPDRLPAGAYRLIAVLYDPDLPGAPRLRTSTGQSYAGLGTVTVR